MTADTTTETLTAFLTRMLDEDEAAARAVWSYHSSPWRIEPGPAGWSVIRSAGTVIDDLDGEVVDHDTFVMQVDTSSTAAHIARHDPARVLAEVAAKRAIVAAHPIAFDRDHPEHGFCEVCQTWDGSVSRSGEDAPCPTLRALASVYAGEPGYQEGWRV